jgi:hypothetical protein
MGTAENIPSEKSSHRGDHSDDSDGKESGSGCEYGSEEKGLEEERRIFLLNDMSSKRIRMTVHGPRRPNTTENRVINEGQNLHR